MLSDVFHGLARVVHKFEEILLEIVLCLGSKLCIEIDVRFQPCGLIKFNRPMNLFKD